MLQYLQKQKKDFSKDYLLFDIFEAYIFGISFIFEAVSVHSQKLLIMFFRALAALKVLSATFKELINVKAAIHCPWRLIENSPKTRIYVVCSRFCFKLPGSQKTFKLPATSFWSSLFNKYSKN